MKKKQKPKLKKSDLVTSKRRFFNLLNKVIRPLSEEDQKVESRHSDENISKRKYPHKTEDAEG